MRYRHCKTLSANSQAVRALSTSSIFSPTLISSRKWQRGAMPARANAFPISWWNSVRTRGLNRRKRFELERRECWGEGEKRKRKRRKGWIRAWIMHHAYILRRTPLVSLWTFDNSVNQLSRISYPLCLLLTPVAVRKSRLIFKRWKEGNCRPTFRSIRSLELNLPRYFHQSWLM